MLSPRASIALPLLAVALALPASAAAAGSASVAALQVALRAHGLYAGDVDGLDGPLTRHALHRAHAVALRRRPLGSRVLAPGVAGWDVAELQFELAAHGFPSGSFDGDLGPHTAAAIRRFQRFARLAVDGRAGPATFSALAAPPPRSPLALGWPLHARLGDRFGPRGARFHTGIDLPAPTGVGVAAAGPGRIAFAGALDGYGLLVTIAHGDGVRTLYAHLSRIDVRLGERVGGGFQVGLVGSTGDATGPHLHFEVRVHGAAVDPLGALR